MSGEVRERYALVICDVQRDLLAKLTEGQRAELLAPLKELLTSAHRANWLVVFTGLRFPAGYQGVPSRHRLFGGLQRLNAKQGDERVHWLMDGYEGTEVDAELISTSGEQQPRYAWRTTLSPGEELLAPIREKCITKVVVAGLLGATQSVLSACQTLMDEGLLVYVVRDCVGDSETARLNTVLDHVLPQLADVIGWAEFQTQISQEMMIDMFVEMKHAKRAG